MIKRCMILWISVLVLSFAATYGLAATWEVHESYYVMQTDPSFAEVLPAEDMDPSHTITWFGGPHSTGGGVRFYPSWNWGTPQPGDQICWLYDSSTQPIWWQGVFNNPCSTIHIQFRSCDTNDGWADIYVDGSLAYSYNTFHSPPANVVIIGRGLTYAAHTIKIQTRTTGPGVGDVSLDYVAHPGKAPSIPTLTEWGLIIFGVILIGFITWVFLKRRKVVGVNI